MSRQAQVTCDRCGVVADPGPMASGIPLGWSRLEINGAVRLRADFCPTCAEDIDRAVKAEMGEE